jgi:hypothetical protein
MMITKTNSPYVFVFLVMSSALVYGMRPAKQPSAAEDLNYERAQVKVFNDSLRAGNVEAAQYALNSLKVLKSPQETNVQNLERQLKDYKTRKAQQDKEKILNEFNQALNEKKWGIAEKIMVNVAASPEYGYLKEGLQEKYNQAKANAGQVGKLKAANPLMETGALRQNINAQKELASKLPKKIE